MFGPENKGYGGEGGGEGIRCAKLGKSCVDWKGVFRDYLVKKIIILFGRLFISYFFIIIIFFTIRGMIMSHFLRILKLICPSNLTNKDH